jgi:hypothetical protein
VTDLIEEAQQWSDQLEANGYDVEQVLADEFGITVDDSGRVEFDFEDFDEYDDLDQPSTGNERLDRMIEVHETDQAYEALKDTLASVEARAALDGVRYDQDLYMTLVEEYDGDFDAAYDDLVERSDQVDDNRQTQAMRDEFSRQKHVTTRSGIA